MYGKVQEKYGNTNVPINTFNKVWILPDQASLLMKDNTVWVLDVKLKVMMEEDYFSPQKGVRHLLSGQMDKKVSDTFLCSQIVREIVIPELEKAVNQSKDFAPLRQIVNSMVLAAWYKKELKKSVLSKAYVNKGKTQGLQKKDPKEEEKIFQDYLKSYKQGVFNYIKEDPSTDAQGKRQMVARKYFSGGFNPQAALDQAMVYKDWSSVPKDVQDRAVQSFEKSHLFAIKSQFKDAAMNTANDPLADVKSTIEGIVQGHKDTVEDIGRVIKLLEEQRSHLEELGGGENNPFQAGIDLFTSEIERLRVRQDELKAAVTPKSKHKEELGQVIARIKQLRRGIKSSQKIENSNAPREILPIDQWTHEEMKFSFDKDENPKGHLDLIFSNQILEDGRILTASIDNTVKIWRRTSKDQLEVLVTLSWPKKEETSISLAQMLPDGRIVMGSHDGKIKIWMQKSKNKWQITSTLESKNTNPKGHEYGINSIQMLPDGRLLTASDDSSAKIWKESSADQWDVAANLEHPNWVTSAQMLKDGRILTTCKDATLKIWKEDSLNQWSVESTLKGHEDIVHSAQMLPDGRILSTSYDRTTKIWRQNKDKSWEVEATLEEKDRYSLGHNGTVVAAHMLEDGRIFTASEDRTVKIWKKISRRKWEVEVTAEVVGLKSAQILSEGKIFIVDAFGSEIWNIFKPIERQESSSKEKQTSQEQMEILPEDQIKPIELLPDEKYITDSMVLGPKWSRAVTVRKGGIIKIWDVPNLKELHTLRDYISWGTVFSLDETRIATMNNSQVIIWDVDKGTKIRTLENITNFKAMSLSSDGTKIVIATLDKIRIWDVNTGVELKRLLGYKTSLSSKVAFSPDGTQVAATIKMSTGEAVRIWDVDTGRREVTLEQPNNIYSMAFSPDGNQIATGSDCTLIVWDIIKRKTIRVWNGHSYFVDSVNFSPDGRMLATASKDGTAKIWNIETGEEIKSFSLGDAVNAVIGFSPDGTSVFITTKDHPTTVIRKIFKPLEPQTPDTDVPKDGQDVLQQELSTLEARKKELELLIAKEESLLDGRLLTDDLKGKIITTKIFKPNTAKTGSSDQAMSADPLAEVKSTIEGIVQGHKDTVEDIGRVIKLLEEQRSHLEELGGVENNPFQAGIDFFTSEIERLKARQDELKVKAAFVPESKWKKELEKVIAQINEIMANQGKRGLLELLPDDQRKMIKTLTGHTDFVRSAAYSRDGRYIVTVSDHKTVRIWDAQTGQQIGEPFRVYSGLVMSAVFSPDGRYILTASDDRTATIWDAQTRQPIETLTGHEDYLTSAAYSPNGRYIVTASHDSIVRIWDAQTGQQIGKPLKGHSNGVYTATYSPDGRYIMTASRDGTVRIWDAQTRQQIGEPLIEHDDSVFSSAVYSPDGRYIVTVSFDGPVRIWDAQTRQPIGEPLKGLDKEVVSVVFSPDSRYIVTAGDDGSVRFWDVQTRQQIGKPLTGFPYGVSTAAYSPDGRYIVLSSDDGAARIWEIAKKLLVPEQIKFHELNSKGDGFTAAVAVASDGKFYVSVTQAGKVRISSKEADGTWSTQEEPINTSDREDITAVALSPDGTYFLTTSYKDVGDGTAIGILTLWNKNSQNKWVPGRRLLNDSPWELTDVAIAPDGSYFVVTTESGKVQIWRKSQKNNEWKQETSVGSYSYKITDVAIAPDSSFFVVVHNNSAVQVYNAKGEPQWKQQISAALNNSLSVAIAPDGKSFVVTDKMSGLIHVWENKRSNDEWVSSGQIVKDRFMDLQDVAISPDGNYCVIVGSQGEVFISTKNAAGQWGEGRFLGTVADPGVEDVAAAVAISPDGTYFVTVDGKGRERIWDVGGPRVGQSSLVVLEKRKKWLERIIAHEDELARISQEREDALKSMEAKNQILRLLPLHEISPQEKSQVDSRIKAIARDGSFMVNQDVSDPNGSITIYNADGQRGWAWGNRRSFDPRGEVGLLQKIVISPQGDYFLTLHTRPESGNNGVPPTSDEFIQIWKKNERNQWEPSVIASKEALIGHEDCTLDLVISADGQSFLTLERHSINVWKNKDGEWGKNQSYYYSGYKALDVFPDGSFVAMGNREVSIWDSKGTQQNVRLTPGGRNDVAVSPDGSYFVIVGSQGKIWIWTKNDQGVWEERTEIGSKHSANNFISVSISADGTHLEVVDERGHVTSWHVAGLVADHKPSYRPIHALPPTDNASKLAKAIKFFHGINGIHYSFSYKRDGRVRIVTKGYSPGQKMSTFEEDGTRVPNDPLVQAIKSKFGDLTIFKVLPFFSSRGEESFMAVGQMRQVYVFGKDGREVDHPMAKAIRELPTPFDIYTVLEYQIEGQRRFLFAGERGFVAVYTEGGRRIYEVPLALAISNKHKSNHIYDVIIRENNGEQVFMSIGKGSVFSYKADGSELNNDSLTNEIQKINSVYPVYSVLNFAESDPPFYLSLHDDKGSTRAFAFKKGQKPLGDDLIKNLTDSYSGQMIKHILAYHQGKDSRYLILGDDVGVLGQDLVDLPQQFKIDQLQLRKNRLEKLIKALEAQLEKHPTDSAQSSRDLGGIDLNPDLLKTDIKTEGQMPQVGDAQLPEGLSNLTGLVPFIIKITPMPLPDFVQNHKS